MYASAKTVATGDDIFRGWLTCVHPECQRPLPMRKSTKLSSPQARPRFTICIVARIRARSTKSTSTSPSKRSGISSSCRLTQVDITETFANDIMPRSMDDTFDKQQRAIKKQMEAIAKPCRRFERTGKTRFISSRRERSHSAITIK